MTPAGFERWMKRAKKGDMCLYHVGDLAYDRWAGTAPVVADVVVEAAQAGKVHLAQHRRTDGEFDYLAIFNHA